MINIQENVILAPYTTFKIGGPAKYFVEVKDEEDLKKALEYALKNKLKFFVLGGGSNVLISDQGFDGLVIRFQNTECKIIENKIECGAGAALLKVVRLAADNSLAGLEWAAGIPGTIGGAVRGNAGAFGSNMHSVVESIRVFLLEEDGFAIKDFTAEECEFEYRNSLFKKNNNLIIFAVFLKLEKGDGEKIQNETSEIIEKRNQMHPQGMASAGSFFVNPKVNDAKLLDAFEKDSGKRFPDNTIPAGWLIQEAGLTGQKIGGAMVSEKHSNFIVNTGNAKAEDVIILMDVIKEKVRTKLGVQLVPEVKFLGF
jgi:UDP-N-acetylmuramate dehydrogenase